MKEERTVLARYSNPERVQEIVRRRLRGEPVAFISADMGISRTYIYSLLSKLPSEDDTDREKETSNIKVPSEENYRIVMDYLESYPSRKKALEFGKKRMDDLITHVVAEMHNLPDARVSDILCHATAHHPMVCHFPLYSSIEKWKMENLVTMRDLSSSAGKTVMEMSNILNGLDHLPLETARKIQIISGLSIYEIYMDLLNLEKEASVLDEQSE